MLTACNARGSSARVAAISVAMGLDAASLAINSVMALMGSLVLVNPSSLPRATSLMDLEDSLRDRRNNRSALRKLSRYSRTDGGRAPTEPASCEHCVGSTSTVAADWAVEGDRSDRLGYIRMEDSRRLRMMASSCSVGTLNDWLTKVCLYHERFRSINMPIRRSSDGMGMASDCPEVPVAAVPLVMPCQSCRSYARAGTTLYA